VCMERKDEICKNKFGPLDEILDTQGRSRRTGRSGHGLTTFSATKFFYYSLLLEARFLALNSTNTG